MSAADDEQARALEARAAEGRRDLERKRRLRALSGNPAARRALAAKFAPLTRDGRTRG